MLVTAQDDNVGGDAHALKLLNGVLGGLGLMLVRAAQKRHERDMDVQRIFLPDLKPYLTDGLKKGLALYIAGGAADLGDDNVRVGLAANIIYKGLYLVCDVRDDLHGLAEIFAAPLLVQDVPVHLAGGEV